MVKLWVIMIYAIPMIALLASRNWFQLWIVPMMTSYNGNIFRITGALRVEGGFPSERPVTWSFDVFFDQQTIEQTIDTPVIWGAIALIMTSV